MSMCRAYLSTILTVIPTEPPAATKAKAVEEDEWRRKPNASACGVLGSRCKAAGTGASFSELCRWSFAFARGGGKVGKTGGYALDSVQDLDSSVSIESECQLQ
jgi:hypothetical protein